jgi:uncharacterized protein YndB with AHSA1/START domain
MTTETADLTAHVAHDEPEMLRLTRLLPGSVERVWQYLTDSKLRGTWLGSGEMDLRPGGTAELTIDNSKLTPGPDNVPPPKYAAHACAVGLTWRIVECEAPRLLVVDWGTSPNPSRVRFELAAEGKMTRLTIEHRRVPNRGMLLSVSAGWHAHTDILRDRLAGREPATFWPAQAKLEAYYEGRIPG